MNQNKEISWQFADDYYKYLLQKISNIDYFLSAEQFDYAFKELQQIFSQINNPIANLKVKTGEKPRYEQFTEYIKKIYDLSNRYTYISMQTRYSRQYMIRLTKVKTELTLEIYKFYRLLMRTIDELNMLFPKTSKGTRGKEVLEGGF